MMLLLAPILFALTWGVPVGVLLWVARRQDRRKAARHGFPVNPTATRPAPAAPDPPSSDQGT